jgi:hypothetical protein
VRRLSENAPAPASQRSSTITLAVIGALAGVASAFNSHAASDKTPTVGGLLATVIGFAVLGAVGFVLIRGAVRRVARSMGADDAALSRFTRGDHWPFAVFLCSFLGAFGVKFTLLVTGAMWAVFLVAQSWWLSRCMGRDGFAKVAQTRSTLAGLFFLSGMAALIYQVVWQRLLFTLFGVNIESVTLIVSVFMFGLGVGAMAGGWMSQKFADRLPELFLWIEIGIGAFGFASVWLIHGVGAVAAGASTPVIAIVVYAVLFFPTLCMGATLPILVAYLHQKDGKLGASVGLLYTFNTAGSALACFLTAAVLFRYMGLTGSVWFAAVLNVLTGWLVFRYCKKAARLKGEGAPAKA